jgi:hypothetical protein
VPRLDIWYKSNMLKGTLPEKYKNSTLREIVNDLGLGAVQQSAIRWSMHLKPLMI